MWAFFPTARLYQHDMLARLKIVTIFLIVHLLNGISGLFVPFFFVQTTVVYNKQKSKCRVLIGQLPVYYLPNGEY